MPPIDSEAERLRTARENGVPWRKWGPYLSERQWGTVREDYSEDGDAWNYFPHDHARSRAYHWGEDGLAGFSDEKQRLCFALALWNGKDPILKERLFGLTNSEGNHGEDVKEYYYYLDSTPTHSYMKYLYKYPQRAYPYDELVAENKKRDRTQHEYELLDAGVFDDDRYFDVFVEYAKASPEDVLIKITIHNRGPEAATLQVLPTLWFRNTWTWWPNRPRPALMVAPRAIAARHPELGERFLHVDRDAPLLFTENETNMKRLFGSPNTVAYVKDGINDRVVSGREDAVNPELRGTKAAVQYELRVPAGGSTEIRLRLNDVSPSAGKETLGPAFDQVLDSRRSEADEFYRGVIPASLGEDEARVMRQALAGMLWSKQYYLYDAAKWLDEHSANPFREDSRGARNKDWFHMLNDNIISMPDKWEYPWFAAWDLAFHAVGLSLVDVDFAKEQLGLMLTPGFQHASGQVPAYEWNFGDVNPPVQAWATLYLARLERQLRGTADADFIKGCFSKLALNFTWWVNRKDRLGKNAFEGGFLGLDNIGVFDRSAPMPTGGFLEQADGTAWMALYCQNMASLSVDLAAMDPHYEDMAVKFMEHFLLIAASLNRSGPAGMWDEEDGFYYDVLRLPDGRAARLKVRSLVGLLPLCAVTAVERRKLEHVPRAAAQISMRMMQIPELRTSIHATGPGHYGVADRGIVALVNQDRLRRILSRMLDEKEFLGDFGIRALSRAHFENPYIFTEGGREHRVGYLPAESDTGMFGGNSNWRGPIWFPVNLLIIRALGEYFLYYGDSFKIECPTGSGRMMNLFQVAQEIIGRLTGVFLRGADGRRPVFGGARKLQEDPHWRDHLLFYEYFHGDNGAGLGASHQTGWTGLVANLLFLRGTMDEKGFLAGGNAELRRAAARR